MYLCPHTGEDLSAGDRKRAQVEQCKGWWEEQAAHKAALQAAQQQAEQAYAELARYQVRDTLRDST